MGFDLFTVNGALKGLSFGLHPAAAILAGVVTRVGSGILRDILTSEVPFALHRRPPPYIVTALLGSGLIVQLSTMSQANGAEMFGTTTLIFLVRMMEPHYGWHIPNGRNRGRTQRVPETPVAHPPHRYTRQIRHLRSVRRSNLMVSLAPSNVPAPFEALGLAFGDVLFQPNESDVISSETAIYTWFSHNIRLNTLPSSAAMDAVAETRMTIAMTREDGVGILYRNLPIDGQAHVVDRVKCSEAGAITQPVTIGPGVSFQEVNGVYTQHRISELSVADNDGTLLGIITSRDLHFEDDGTRPVGEVITKIPLVTTPIGISNDDTPVLLARNKIEKLFIVDLWNRPRGLIAPEDFVKADKCPNVAKDDTDRSRVGVVVGFFGDAWERAVALVEQGMDCAVVNTTHDHSQGMVNMTRCIRADSAAAGADVIGDNVATYTGARAPVGVGTDGVKVGIRPGLICAIHVVAGVGVPQVTAIHDVARVARPHGMPVIGDGGPQYSGDIAKAVVAGANSVMLGSLLVGYEESPGDLVFINGKQFKTYRGMDPLGAVVVCGRKASYSKDHYFRGGVTDDDKLIPEGIEGWVAYRSSLTAIVYQLVGGLRQSVFYPRVRTIDGLQEHGRFVQIITAGL